MNFYVYALVDPSVPNDEFGGQPFYIGKGKGKRLQSHLKGTKNAGGNRLKEDRISQIRLMGYEPQAVVIQIFELEVDALNFERELIDKYGRQVLGGSLTNICSGGTSTRTGVPHTADSKRLMREAKLGKKFTDQHKANLSAARKGKPPWNKGKTLDKDYCQKLSTAQTGKKQSDETKEKRASKLRGLKRSPEVVAHMRKARWGK